MTDFLTTFLASILHEQGVPNAVQVAEKAGATMRKAKIVDEARLRRAQIRLDPSRDYRAVARKYHVTVSFVYRAWRGL